jgi:uncharacterized protein YecE (DUF72 family)
VLVPLTFRVGTAGWANPSDQQAIREAGLSHLQHYAQRFNCVEINSSFYRLHRRATYERWARDTESDFRFAVKMPKAISHDAGLSCPPEELNEFLKSVKGLGAKLAVLLLQLPPQSEFQLGMARRFLRQLRDRIEVPVVCEPRHPSWAATSAARLLHEFNISWVCADPERVSRASGRDEGLRYYRLHGSPRLYWSSYADADLRSLANQMTQERASVSQLWCIFDNTAAGAAWLNAQSLNTLLYKVRRRAHTASNAGPVGRQLTPPRPRLRRLRGDGG